MPNQIKFTKSPQLTMALISLLSLPAFLISPAVHADANDPLNFIAGLSRQHDDNLFRLASLAKGDNITTGYAGIQLDKLYAMQQFKFDYTLTAYRYQNNSILDFNSQAYKAAWLWTLTPYLTGTLSADRQEQLNDFQDYRNFTLSTLQNVRVTQSQHFEADFSPHGVWHLLGGATRSELRNSQTFREQDDFTMNSADAGVRYVFRSGSAITLMGHDKYGVYDQRAIPTPLYDNSFNEKEAEAKLNWLLSGKSQINVRAAYLKREDDHFSLRNYSGTVGSFDYTWTPEGKLRVTISASSDLSDYETSYSSYTRNNTLSVSPLYAFSDKITMQANVSISERTFLGMGIPQSVERVDTGKSASIGVNWAPLRSFSFGGNVMRSSRSSNYTGFDYSDTTAGINANLFF